jgi:hypothetical protein
LAALGGAVALTALADDVAYPGAWMQEQGSGEAILSGAFTTSDYAFAPDGRTIRSSSFTKTEVDLFSEYGMRDWLTTIIQGGLTSRRVGEPFPSSFAGFDVSEFGARLRLWQQGNAVFSLQVTQSVPGGGHGFESAQYGNTDPGTDLRALAGYSFKLGLRGYQRRISDRESSEVLAIHSRRPYTLNVIRSIVIIRKH